MHVAARRRAGDPAAAAVGGGAVTVQRRRELPAHEGAGVDESEDPGAVECLRLFTQQTVLDLDTCRTQSICAAGGDRVVIRHREDHAPNSRRDQCLGTRPGAAGVVAGFESHHCRGALRRWAGSAQGRCLGMRRTRPTVEPLGDHCVLFVEEHASHPRVGTQPNPGSRRNGQRTLHRASLGGGDGHLLGPWSGRELIGDLRTVTIFLGVPPPGVRFSSGL